MCLLYLTDHDLDTNFWYSAYLPISASGAFDNTGHWYDPALVVNDGIFNTTAYVEYSPIYLPITYVLSYGLAFASFTALLSHTLRTSCNPFLIVSQAKVRIVWYRHDIVRLFRSSLSDHKDVHARLMTSYKKVPGWWYAATGVITFTIAVITIEVYPTQVCLASPFAVCFSLIRFSDTSLGSYPGPHHCAYLCHSSWYRSSHHQPDLRP